MKRSASSAAVDVVLAAAARLAALVEAAAALRAELAARDQLAHALVHVEALAVGLLQVLGDGQHRVEPDHVGERERSDRRGLGGDDRRVDGGDREAVLLLGPPELAERRRRARG